MSNTKPADLRQMTDEELAAGEERAREELFRLRFRQHTAQLTNTSELCQKRRELARILTTMEERRRGISFSPEHAVEQTGT